MKTSLRIARHVIRDIIEQELPPGTRLPGESALMESYNVSRSSIREALRILETNGFVTVRPGPGGGPIVNEVQPEHFGRTTALFLQMKRSTLAQVFDARVHLEALLVKIAAQRRDEEFLTALHHELDRHRAYTEFDSNSYLSLTQDFHRMMTAATDNGVIELFTLSLQSIVRDRVTPVRAPSPRWHEVISEHLAIGQAIFDGDPARAQALMEQHMAGFCQGYRERYPGLIDEVIDGD